MVESGANKNDFGLSETRKILSSYKKDELCITIQIFQAAAKRNPDICLVMDTEEEEILPIIEEETGEDVRISYNQMFDAQERELLHEFLDFDAVKTRKKKSELVDLLMEFLSDENIRERICVSLFTSDEESARLWQQLGLEDWYKKLKKSNVYQARRSYAQLLNRYAEAAVNFYGVVSVKDLLDIIYDYDPEIASVISEDDGSYNSKYQKKNGICRYTIAYDPLYLSETMLHHILESSHTNYLLTYDAMLVNPCFLKEYWLDQQILIRALKQSVDKYGPDLEGMTDSGYGPEEMNKISYRRLYLKARRYPFCMPPKQGFLIYAEKGCREISQAEKNMQLYLQLKYMPDIMNCLQNRKSSLESMENLTDEEAKLLYMKPDEWLDSMFDDLHSAFEEKGKNWDSLSQNDRMKDFFNILKEYGVPADAVDSGEKTDTELIGRAISLMNSCRRWSLSGWTPEELYLQTGQDVRIKNRTATTIGKVRRIYPNDPCPCGSGKKYKKCCGRKK